MAEASRCAIEDGEQAPPLHVAWLRPGRGRLGPRAPSRLATSAEAFFRLARRETPQGRGPPGPAAARGA